MAALYIPYKSHTVVFNWIMICRNDSTSQFLQPWQGLPSHVIVNDIELRSHLFQFIRRRMSNACHCLAGIASLVRNGFSTTLTSRPVVLESAVAKSVTSCPRAINPR